MKPYKHNARIYYRAILAQCKITSLNLDVYETVVVVYCVVLLAVQDNLFLSLSEYSWTRLIGLVMDIGTAANVRINITNGPVVMEYNDVDKMYTDRRHLSVEAVKAGNWKQEKEDNNEEISTCIEFISASGEGRKWKTGKGRQQWRD